MKFVEEFKFIDYDFDVDTGVASFRYSYPELDIEFEEKLELATTFKEYDKPTLDRALEMYHLIAGVSYYKMFVAKNFTHPYEIDEEQAKFYSDIYRHGLGEFLYRNEIDPQSVAVFSSNQAKQTVPSDSCGASDITIIPVSGGKDSLLSYKLVEGSKKPVYMQSSNTVPNIIAELDNLYLFKRVIDPKLRNEHDGFNGHVPFSAILDAALLIIAVLEGASNIALSHEKSADEPTVAQYFGEPVNHQWSK